MIEDLDKVLDDTGLHGLIELRGLLGELLDREGVEVRLTEQQSLQSRPFRVFRLRFAINGRTQSVVVKRLKPEIARCNELVVKRWLPAIGMEEAGPPVLGVVAARTGDCVWHVYADLGDWALDTGQPDRERVKAAIDLIARIHTGFASHPLLGEVRLHGGDLGIHFYETNARDAIYALEACQPTENHKQLHDRLLERLYKMLDELPERTKAFREWGGPETLLHGDLWAINVFVIPGAKRMQARLIDWDHVAVGPAAYDVSTFLLRFPPEHRPWILELYGNAVAHARWRLPRRQLNFLFETSEYARIANRVIWPAIALVRDQASWGWETLAEVDDWFKHFKPVLPDESGTPAAKTAAP